MENVRLKKSEESRRALEQKLKEQEDKYSKVIKQLHDQINELSSQKTKNENNNPNRQFTAEPKSEKEGNLVDGRSSLTSGFTKQVNKGSAPITGIKRSKWQEYDVETGAQKKADKSYEIKDDASQEYAKAFGLRGVEDAQHYTNFNVDNSRGMKHILGLVMFKKQ